MSFGAWTIATAAAVCLVARAAPARAGPLFAHDGSSVTVTEQRVAISASAGVTRTWDQVRFSGAPEDFVMVVPVLEGTRIEASRPELFTALDLSTRVRVRRTPGETYDGPGSCWLFACSSEAFDAGDPTMETTPVVRDAVVGPYEVVRVRPSQGESVTDWLMTNAYVFPPDFVETARTYATAKHEFVVLRFRPSCGEQATQPFRFIAPAVVPTVALRAHASGRTTNLAVSLWLVTSKRSSPANFPWAEAPFASWDDEAERSDYPALAADVLARADGATWLLEADHPIEIGTLPWVGTPYAPESGTAYGGIPLPNAYFGQCLPLPGSTSLDDLVDGSASLCAPPSIDAGAPVPSFPVGDDGGPTHFAPEACRHFDDLDVAMSDMMTTSARIAKYRAVLPPAALQKDLEVGARLTGPDFVGSDVYATTPAPPGPIRSLLCGQAQTRRSPLVPVALALLSVVAVVRRYARRR